MAKNKQDGGRQPDTRRSWLTMTLEEKSHYLRLVTSATESIMPKDCRFSLILYGQDGTVCRASNINQQAEPDLLRHIAAEIDEQNLRKTMMN